ncbi:aspartyl protease family protein [Pseudomonas sp. CGJS7]
MRGAYATAEASLPGVDQPLHLVIDSTSRDDVIDRKFAWAASALEQDASEDAQVRHLNGRTAPPPMVRFEGMRVGNMTLTGPFTVAETELSTATSEESVDGILGTNVIALYDATFDIKRGELLLRSSAVDEGRCYLNSYPGRSEALRKISFMDVSLRKGGSKVRAVIDTGASHTVMNLAAAMTLRLRPGDLSLRRLKRVVKNTSSTAVPDTWLYDLPRLEIGEWLLGPTEVRISQLPIFDELSPDGQPTIILGIDVLRQRRITIKSGAAAFCVSRGDE